MTTHPSEHRELETELANAIWATLPHHFCDQFDEEDAQAMRERLGAAALQAIRQRGECVVPVEPTEEMLEAATQIIIEPEKSLNNYEATLYRAMVSASQERAAALPSEGQDGR